MYKYHNKVNVANYDNIISQIVQISKVCDQNGDRVSKNSKICHVWSVLLKGRFSEIQKNGTLSIYI